MHLPPTHGPPGTGKTAFGRWLADELKRPLHVKRYSDLSSCYVGEAEKNIAKAFADAETEGAVLMLDEVDSFLQDRRNARANWEVTAVNEMLTQMETYEGLFIASTNLVDNLDAASLRRFDLKLAFDYLDPDQAEILWRNHCRQLGLKARTADAGLLRALTHLTPGDFATASIHSKTAAPTSTPSSTNAPSKKRAAPDPSDSFIESWWDNWIRIHVGA